MVVLVLQVSQVYQVRRVTRVCPARLVLLGSLVLKERLVSLETPVPQDLQVLQAPLVFLCQDPKVCKDLQDLPEEQVPPVLRVLVVQEALVE